MQKEAEDRKTGLDRRGAGLKMECGGVEEERRGRVRAGEGFSWCGAGSWWSGKVRVRDWHLAGLVDDAKSVFNDETLCKIGGEGEL